VPPPLVLLHGFTQTGRAWDGVRAELPGALAPDLRGHGAAAAVRPVTFDAVVADLDALAPAGAVLAGYSLGGRTALHYAAARPGRLAALVLLSASPGLADPGERAARRADDAALADRVEAEGVEAFAREWAAQPLFADQPPHVAAAAHADRLRQDPAGLAAALRGLGTGVMAPLWDALPGIHLPVTLIAGGRDAKFVAIAEQMAAALPDARVVLVEGAGHAVHLERPDAVAAALRSSTGRRTSR
jgi:2-succinyl-6-hydroxy-2,4-cyclohexadiene-1-carboxylate synthase